MAMSDDTKPKPIVVSNPWGQLRQYTAARIALGRAGTSLPTQPHLEFQLAHARARNAVQHELDVGKLQSQLKALSCETVVLHSAAEHRPMYLQRPDKGRRLNERSRQVVSNMARPQGGHDIVVVIGDGLSSFAIEENAAALLAALLPAFHQHGLSIAPLFVVQQARVAIGDEIGELLGAKMVVVLIGERPGLSSPDSLGIYMTLNPRVGLTDETRNCISNVRREGLSYEVAVHKLMYLIVEARKRGLSGVQLKDEAQDVATKVAGPTKSFLIEQTTGLAPIPTVRAEVGER